jgi:hypothetical protein
VNLSWSAVKASRSGQGSGIGGSGSGSGSAIRYSSDSGARVNPGAGVRPDNTPLPAALAGTKPPQQPPPPGQFWETQTHPPLLPASATHGLVGGRSAQAPLRLTPSRFDEEAPAGQANWLRDYAPSVAALVAALAAVVALGALIAGR